MTLRYNKIKFRTWDDDKIDSRELFSSWRVCFLVLFWFSFLGFDETTVFGRVGLYEFLRTINAEVYARVIKYLRPRAREDEEYCHELRFHLG